MMQMYNEVNYIKTKVMNTEKSSFPNYSSIFYYCCLWSSICVIALLCNGSVDWNVSSSSYIEACTPMWLRLEIGKDIIKV